MPYTLLDAYSCRNQNLPTLRQRSLNRGRARGICQLDRSQSGGQCNHHRQRRLSEGPVGNRGPRQAGWSQSDLLPSHRRDYLAADRLQEGKVRQLANVICRSTTQGGTRCHLNFRSSKLTCCNRSGKCVAASPPASRRSSCPRQRRREPRQVSHSRTSRTCWVFQPARFKTVARPPRADRCSQNAPKGRSVVPEDLA